MAPVTGALSIFLHAVDVWHKGCHFEVLESRLNKGVFVVFVDGKQTQVDLNAREVISYLGNLLEDLSGPTR